MNLLKKDCLFIIFLLSSLWIFQACTNDVIPTPLDCEAPPSIEITTVTDATCGSSNGAIEVIGSGGIEPYNFVIEGVAESATGEFNQLFAGSYTVAIKDSRGCTETITAEIKNSNGLNITVTSTDSGCSNSTGSIEILASEGTEPYLFSIDAVNFSESNEFTQLAPGNYNVVTKDATDCTITKNVKIKSDVAFAQVQSIITANCAVSNCHDGSITPDFRNAQNINSRASQIKSRTSSKSMPPASSGRSLSATEIQNIACWANDGV